jgi:3-dehydroquinate synthase
MINKFTIQNTELYADTTIQDKITIKSHPQNYNVVFHKFTNSFQDNEVVLVDKNVQQLYNIQHSKMIVVEAIEENKCIETVLNVCEKLMDFDFDKGCTLIVIGGGIIQDIGAYTAKTFRRGINWIFYPTTLLSQCDSCIGGKTALNFKTYKNQLALFSAPNEVIIDTDFLNTLSDKDIMSGYGEIIKLFLTGGQYYIDNFDNFTILEKIYHSLSIKKAVVECDEFEKLERKSLNYGHSFGHVIETLTNYNIPHGEAVMLGIEIINKIFTKSPAISSIISRYTTLDKIKNIDVSKLVTGLKTDKKVANGSISFVVVPQPGITVFLYNTIDKSLENLVHEIFID